jgi:hypothetical protein
MITRTGLQQQGEGGEEERKVHRLYERLDFFYTYWGWPVRNGVPYGSLTYANPVSTPQAMPVMHCTRLRMSQGASEGLRVALDVL